VVALHGCTQTASDFAAGTRLDAVAEGFGAYVVYPEQTVAANAQRCWNWYRAQDQGRAAGEPAAILALVADIAERFPIDRQRVYVVGLSAGGAMAAILAEQAPDVFSGAGIMAGIGLHASSTLADARGAMRGEARESAEAVARGNGAYARLRLSRSTRRSWPGNSRGCSGSPEKRFSSGAKMPKSHDGTMTKAERASNYGRSRVWATLGAAAAFGARTRVPAVHGRATK
jgi:poly(hydroxyalkanoate) depolymerase family esterase